jgi:AcrR family transcriptional regulator
MAKPVILPFNEPLQERSQRTVEQILMALEDLLRDRPFDDISIAEIIAKAGVSAGSFYARFPTKNALLPVAYARYSAAAATALDEKFSAIAFQQLRLRQRIEALLAMIVDSFGVKKWLMRAMTLFARQRPGDVSDDAAKRSARTLELGAQALSPSDNAKHAAKVKFATFVMTTVAREYALFAEAPLTRAMTLPRKALERELSDMIEAYLRGARIT